MQMFKNFWWKSVNRPVAQVCKNRLRRVISARAISFDRYTRFPTHVESFVEHNLNTDHLGQMVAGMIDHLLNLILKAQFRNSRRSFSCHGNGDVDERNCHGSLVVW